MKPPLLSFGHQLSQTYRTSFFNIATAAPERLVTVKVEADFSSQPSQTSAQHTPPTSEDDEVATRPTKRQRTRESSTVEELPTRMNLGDLLKSTVIINIGMDSTPITVHKELLCHYSRSFQTLVDDVAGSIDCEEEDERIFRMFVAWLYSQKLAPPSKARVVNDQELLSHQLVSTSTYAEAEEQGLLRAVNIGTRLALEESQPGVETESNFTIDSEEGKYEFDYSSTVSDDAEEEQHEETRKDGQVGGDEEPQNDVDDADPTILGDGTMSVEEQKAADRRLYVEEAGVDEMDLVDLYLLVDRRNVPQLRDAVVTHYIYEHSRTQTIASPAAIAAAYSTPSRRLGRVMLREHARFGGSHSGLQDAEELAKLPPAFLAQLLAALHEKHSDPTEWPANPHNMMNLCAYHEHDDTEGYAACEELKRNTLCALQDRRWEFYQKTEFCGSRPLGAEESKGVAANVV
ncbi:hypothetical protein LTR17_017227 [Elasticomyces elasticus]|nr:hypothetical protein LTR17_017227 [Elasticomyces elasticus]